MIIAEQILLEFRIELEELITEREGMIAENKQREVVENSMAYDEGSFSNVASRMSTLRKKIIGFVED